ncbi:MAG: PQQ-binding-like beta-propeller repeat protein [Anaerolineaceae bacterium]|nr:PQQ-binding-like beta-propeller repeat protein [Anaerolineaceae bacterium]
MKLNRLFLVLIFLILGGLLASCGNIMTGSGWPGLTASGERVYLSSGTQVMALRASDGILIWGYPEKADSKVNFYAPPAVIENQIIVGDYHNSLHAIDATNGTPQWVFNDNNGRFVAGVLVQDDLILAPSANHKLYALDLDGNLRWKYATKQALWAKPVSDGELVYQAGMDHHVYALRLSDGSLVWKTNLGGAAMFSPALSEDGMLFVGSLAKEMAAIKAENGVIQWRFSTAAPIWSQALLHNGTLYFGDTSGAVYALDAESGNPRWRMELTGPVISSPALMEAGVVFSTENGDIQALSFDGAKLWTRSVSGKLYGQPAVGDNLLVFGLVKGDNLAVAFDFNGNERWTFVTPK